ncbi:DNA-3-methyladenine glycosylase 2 family protein [Halomonas sp. ML-15]|uniref:DNA-3-methyladenine glycosylase 2 family protein n=1 Tax=Halomonas sp. ML-15 TaxID=2773305 RepID=UPI001747B9D3|nr:DNA-3-methyladenine glycosylase 2 family protein [Halomonas sp. ML-15]MBD3896425.1 DNA-3-methyladenine glycosylase 2 family protein [Halomonas sp. ML-15]
MQDDATCHANAPATPHSLELAYRPPYAWQTLHDFYAKRAIHGLEWVDNDRYGRTIHWGQARGRFTAVHRPARNGFEVHLQLDAPQRLDPVVGNIRRLLDLDADTALIESHLSKMLPGLALVKGLRLPGIWSPFEAGVRAILGQQVSVAAARRLVTTLVGELGDAEADGQRHFPTAEQIAASDLAFLGMPDARRQTLRRFAAWHASDEADDDPRAWTTLKGIGPWSADYAALRGTSHPDIWLGGDLGIRKALPALQDVDPRRATPWRSYLTFQLWSR